MFLPCLLISSRSRLQSPPFLRHTTTMYSKSWSCPSLPGEKPSLGKYSVKLVRISESLQFFADT